MIVGILFIVVWLALAGAWFVVSGMVGAMANDSGSVDSGFHANMLILLMIGELVVAVAGVLGGSSFVFATVGAGLWRAFWILLAVGILLQVAAVGLFLMRA
jgi:hypothetical protein